MIWYLVWNLYLLFMRAVSVACVLWLFRKELPKILDFLPILWYNYIVKKNKKVILW